MIIYVQSLLLSQFCDVNILKLLNKYVIIETRAVLQCRYSGLATSVLFLSVF